MDRFIRDWLSHQEWWFHPQHSYDETITAKYGDLLEEPITNTLACLVVHDQVARHKYRGQPDIVHKHLEIALSIHSKIDPNKLNSLEWVFYALPIRHSKDTPNIFKIIQEAWVRIKKETNPKYIIVLIHFLKASYSRCDMEQDRLIEENQPDHCITNLKTFIEYSDILHYCPVHQYPNPTHRLYQLFEKFIIHHTVKEVILSVSGGVDSQVCSYILSRLQQKYGFGLVAVYINYNNRTIKEYQFVKDWCNFIEVPLYVRHITEIKRKPCMEYGLRAIYEEYTRQVRYNTYKAVWNKLQFTTDVPKVLLGHNQDDTFENILTNLSNKSHYDNLRGMTEIQVVDDIMFYRPMLDIPKEHIYQYANDIGIPYLQDSTPSWSQRGQIRDKVRPTLETWDEQFVPSMFQLSKRLSEYELFVTEVVKHVVQQSSNQYTIPDTELYYTHLFWETLFKKLEINCSYKSLQNLIEALHTKKHSQQVNINKSTILYYTRHSNNIHIILKTI